VIFVTVGTQLPFERLVATVDAWAGRQATPLDVLAQVGSGRCDYSNLRCVRSLDAEAYARTVDSARLVIAHAGTGSILTALDRGLPVIVFPRDHRHREHRDDHQLHTARQMEAMGIVQVAWHEAQLVAMIEHELAVPPGSRPPRRRGTELVDFLRDWLRTTLDR
jgi:UDP-N-acetylglucosamine transferase subunit ALG13